MTDKIPYPKQSFTWPKHRDDLPKMPKFPLEAIVKSRARRLII